MLMKEGDLLTMGAFSGYEALIFRHIFLSSNFQLLDPGLLMSLSSLFVDSSGVPQLKFTGPLQYKCTHVHTPCSGLGIVFTLVQWFLTWV